MGPEPDPTSTVPGMAIWGWMTPPELEWLAAQAARMGSVVEVGCLHGRSAFALLTACPGPVYCIDPWDDDHDKSYPSFLHACGHFPNLVAVRAASPAATKQVPGPVDMTFLDGSHVYEAVLADIAAWLPRTTRLLCGHDYYPEEHAGFPGVPRAVNQVFGDRVTVAPGTCIWAVDVTEDRSVAAGLPTGLLEFTDEYGRAQALEVAW